MLKRNDLASPGLPGEHPDFGLLDGVTGVEGLDLQQTLWDHSLSTCSMRLQEQTLLEVSIASLLPSFSVFPEKGWKGNTGEKLLKPLKKPEKVQL